MRVMVTRWTHYARDSAHEAQPEESGQGHEAKDRREEQSTSCPPNKGLQRRRQGAATIHILDKEAPVWFCEQYTLGKGTFSAHAHKHFILHTLQDCVFTLEHSVT